MSTKILVLEDDSFRVRFFIERFGHHDIKITENAYDAIELLSKFTFDYLFLDNDLGQGNGEGVDVAEYLQHNSDNRNNQSIIIIHSWNRPATVQIKARLPYAVVAPFNTESFFNLRLDI